MSLSDILGDQIHEVGGPGSSIIRPSLEEIAQINGGNLPKEDRDLLPTAQRIARNTEAYFENPWTMIEDGVIWTLDEADKLNPVKLFPNRPWLQAFSAEWMTEDLIAIVKSRRMMISWLFIFLHLWMVLFLEGRSVFFVSDKEEKSDELIDRVEFIYNHIPDDAFLKPAIKRTYCHFEVPGLNNYILGVAQGARQLAQYTASALFFDEFAHWERARETFMAAKPTIDGGGKVTLVSSPKEGFYKELCFDMIR